MSAEPAAAAQASNTTTTTNASASCVDSGADATSGAALDLDVVLLQMSQRFNTDLDVRSAATVAATTRNTTTGGSGSGGATTTAAGRSTAEHRVDRTMKWRGLLKNKFASTASRRGGSGRGRREPRGRGATSNGRAPPTTTTTTAAAAAAAAAQRTHRTAVNVAAIVAQRANTDNDSDEPLMSSSQQHNDEDAAGATATAAAAAMLTQNIDNDGGDDVAVAAAAVVDKPKRVLRRHATASSSASSASTAPAAAAKRQPRTKGSAANGGKVETEAQSPAPETITKALDDEQQTEVEPAVTPIIKRKGRPKRSPTETAELMVESVEPKKRRSRRGGTQQSDAVDSFEVPKEEPVRDESVDEKSKAIEAKVLENQSGECDTKEEDIKPMCVLYEGVDETKHDAESVVENVATPNDDQKIANSLDMVEKSVESKVCAEVIVDAVSSQVNAQLIAPDDVKTEESKLLNEATVPDASEPEAAPHSQDTPTIAENPAAAAVNISTVAVAESVPHIPKKRGRKPGYRKHLHAATAMPTKKSARHSRDTDPDPAFDPAGSGRSTADGTALPPPQRLSRRIKPTAKILANDELRYGFELQNNARLSLSSEHLDAAAERSPAKDDLTVAPFVFHVPSSLSSQTVTVTLQPAPSPHQEVVQPKSSSAMTNGAPSSAAVLPPNGHPIRAMRPPCPDPAEFLQAIKLAKINLHRSPEDNMRRMSVKQKRRLFKRKEKHLHKLGLQRRTKAVTISAADDDTIEGDGFKEAVAAGDDDDDDDYDIEEEEFVPTQKIANVGRPSVTLRLRANTHTDAVGATTVSLAPAKKRTYAVVKTSNETSLILSTKHKRFGAADSVPQKQAAFAEDVNGGDGHGDEKPPSHTSVKPAANICLCGQPSQYYTHRTAATIHCRAVDEIAGQRIGCCNTAATTTTTDNTGADVVLLNLRRPSVRVAYTVLCAGHMQRLAAHHSCAGCGVFCTHGRFAMCARRHLFHRECATKFILSAPTSSGGAGAANASFVGPQLVLRCPHCGTEAPERETVITMRCRGGAPPVFVPDQRRPAKRAKMSIGAHTYASAAATMASSGGGRSFVWELEKLIPAHVQDVVLRAQHAAMAATAGRMVHGFGSREMCKAINANDLEMAVRIIVAGYDITTPLPEIHRGTCLHLVANGGSLAMAYLILSRASPPRVDDFLNRRDRELRTALMCAVLGAKNETTRMLVQCGADVTARGPGGMTALHLAAKMGNFGAVQIILEAHRRATSVHRFALFVNAVDDGGWTTIVWAAEFGHAEMVEYLVQCGADLGVCDAERNTVLHWAALSDDVATVRPLLLGADLNVQNVNGDTPLHIACRNSNTRMCLIFLAHGASLELQNDLGATAFDGIQDVHGSCARAVEFNMKLRAIARFEMPTVVCQDISKGRETYPIKVIRRQRRDKSLTRSPEELDIDEHGSVPHFTYITQSIILQNANVQIDRRISQMRVCACVDNCTSASCQCSEISVQNWYNAEGRLNGSFNFADPAMIFECSDVCGCNKLLCRNRVVQRGQNVALQVIECGGAKGWGVSAVGDVARGTFVAEYTGEILTDAEADRRTDSSYFFDLDAAKHCIDANYYGNVSRFFNHSCEPNVVPIRVYYDHQDLRFPKIAFFAMRNIAADEEITFDYGEKFWLNRNAKQLRCECQTVSCRFGGGPPAIQNRTTKT